ncbi:MAG: hypothetical protein AAGU06_00335 [Candidatus Shapirobacteria bacterium]
MTPEKKSESIVNLPPKIKKAIAGGIVAASLVTGCNVAVEALPHEKPIITSTSVPTKDPETNTDPTQATYELTPTQKATDTMINPPTLTPEPTAIVNPDIEIVDAELAEQIKSAMPPMWFYDHDQKKFVERSNEDFQFSIYKRTTLYISDGNGEEVGFARYFTKSILDNESTEYFSLTDISKDTVIPLKLYSQMGDYDAKSMTLSGNFDTKQCMFGFVEEYTEFKMDTVFPQEAVDMSEKYAPDTRNIQKGEKMVEAALLKTLANITNESEEKLFKNFQNGVTIGFETNKGKWVVNRGINYIWNDASSRSYEILNGELFLFNGFSDISITDAIEGCRPMAWDTEFRTFLNDYFGGSFSEAIEIYKFNSQPFVGRNIRQTPVVVDLRED